jgi:hypothetical protein
MKDYNLIKYYRSYDDNLPRMKSEYYGKNENDKFFQQIDKINQENSSFAKEEIKKELHEEITKAIPSGKINIDYLNYYGGNITPVVKNECKLLTEQNFNVTQCSVSYLHDEFIATIKALKNDF